MDERAESPSASVAARPRKAPPDQKPSFPPFASKADDLEALKKSVEDAAIVGGGLWLSYLFGMLYTAVSAGGVKHVDLLLDKAVNLPFLNVELPLKAFFVLAPVLFLISHAYTLAHFDMLAKKTERFHEALHAQLPGKLPDNPAPVAIREGLRAQLPSNIFVQLLAGPEGVRASRFGLLLMVIAWTTLVFGPICLLVLLQMQFLPYHEYHITWIHRVVLLIDLVLVWWLWGSILAVRSSNRASGPTAFLIKYALIIASIMIVYFSWIFSMTPWELDTLPEKFRGPIARLHNSDLHLRIFDTGIDGQTQRPKGWLADTLVLQDFNINDALKIADPDNIKAHNYLFSLRKRDMNNANFINANMNRVDFGYASVQSAYFQDAKLRGSKFHHAQIASIPLANPAYVNFPMDDTDFSRADLQDASFAQAQLRNVIFTEARLQGADFNAASLEGARFSRAQLQGANFSNAHLKNVSFESANLQGADFSNADLQGAHFENAQLSGCNFEHKSLAGAMFDSANLNGASFGNVEFKDAKFADLALKGAIIYRSQSIGGGSVEKIDEAALARSLRESVCEADHDDLYILRGLLKNGRIQATGRKARALVVCIMSADCPVSGKLTAGDKEDLRAAARHAANTAPEAAAADARRNRVALEAKHESEAAVRCKTDLSPP